MYASAPKMATATRRLTQRATRLCVSRRMYRGSQRVGALRHEFNQSGDIRFGEVIRPLVRLTVLGDLRGFKFSIPHPGIRRDRAHFRHASGMS